MFYSWMFTDIAFEGKTTIIEPLHKYPYCLLLVGSRNGFERDFIIKFKKNWGPYGRLA